VHRRTNVKNDVERVRELLPTTADPSSIRDPDNDLGAAPESILRRILATPESTTATVDPGRRRAHRRLSVALALMAMAAVTALFAVRLVAHDALAALPIAPTVTARSPSGQQPTPHELLIRAAAAAQREQAVAPGGRPVRYQRVMAAYLRTVGGSNPASVLAPETTETWSAPDGSGMIRHTAAAPIWPSAEDRERWNASGAGLGGSRTDHFKAIDQASRGKSTDPRVLDEQLRALVPGGLSGDDVTAWLMAQLRDVLAAPAASPELRRAALLVAADLPFTSFGAVRDQLGRPGYAVGIDSRYSGKLTRYEWIISGNGALLEYQQVLLQSGSYIQARPPVQIEFEIATARSWVPDVAAEPSGKRSR
jgi:hypothetical protein